MKRALLALALLLALGGGTPALAAPNVPGASLPPFPALSGPVVDEAHLLPAGGLPGLSQIPIVGVLFGTNVRHEENVENFLFIVPTVVQSVPRAQADRITEALHVYEDYGSIGGHGLGDIELIEPSPPGFE